MNLIKQFREITMADVPLVGGKNASLGQMIRDLSAQGVAVPDGFAITTHAYRHFIKTNHVQVFITQQLTTIKNSGDTKAITRASKRIRTRLLQAPIPATIQDTITAAYRALETSAGHTSPAVAVRSSATAEDLPNLSFAGVHESFLNIVDAHELLHAWKQCIASLFTPRAITYRMVNGITHDSVALSVGVQHMVRSDRACAGVAFTIDTETGFPDVVVINASYGLGESVVKGIVTPDTIYIHKPRLRDGYKPILSKIVGNKKTKIIYANHGTKQRQVPKSKRRVFCLTDNEIVQITRWSMIIENHYSRINGHPTPMDIEWAKDGITKKIYIVQARPETVHALHAQTPGRYQLTVSPRTAKKQVLLSGQAIGQRIVAGTVMRVTHPSQHAHLPPHTILVTTMTNPDWVPLIKQAAGLITDQGGRTCHAAIVSRELGIPALIGTQTATHILTSGQTVTLDCSQGEIGYVYQGSLPFTVQQLTEKQIKPPVPLMLNIAQPQRAFALANLPIAGVGLARTEFIIADTIGIHPLALLNPGKTDRKTRNMIKKTTAAYKNPKNYFVDVLAQEISTIAAAFWPKPIYVRLSDFKTSEYRQLLGGQFFEPHESNPMLGLRGASRYYHPRYRQAFALECAAFKQARNIKGFTNICVMVPFVRTIKEAQIMNKLLATHGLKRSNDLKHIMMCELPSNALNIHEFSRYFDAFSIGSNDLTQLTLGIDRDEATLSSLFHEDDLAVKKLIMMAIQGAHQSKRTISICGQAPSDNKPFADWLIAQKIDALSLNADAVIAYTTAKKRG